MTAGYGVSWAYLVGDVGFNTYKAREQGPTLFEAAHMTEPTRLGLVTVKRAVFQGLASMALPAFTIHSAVKYAGRKFATAKSPVMKRWGPTMVGIGIVPFLPYLFDEPVSLCCCEFEIVGGKDLTDRSSTQSTLLSTR